MTDTATAQAPTAPLAVPSFAAALYGFLGTTTAATMLLVLLGTA